MSRSDGRADGDDPSAGAARGIERRRGFGAHGAPLRMHAVPRSIVGLDRQKGARTDMQGHLVKRDAPGSQGGHSPSVKCSPAVGAATEPSSRANMV